MELNVSVVDLSANQKKIQVEIPAEKVRKEIEVRYRDLAKKVRIKGFRPGKVPRSVIKSYFGKNIEDEVSAQFIQETFPEALRETSLKPLTEANVSESRFDDNGGFFYSAVVDVCPPFQVEGYRGMALDKAPVTVTEEQVAEELEILRDRQAQLRTVDEDRPIQEGDVVVMDFMPYMDGKAYERGAAVDHMEEMGKPAVHPEFDKNLLGHRPGDVVTFELDYPENAPNPEVSGKRIEFKVTIKDIKEKEVPPMDDDLARAVGKFETLDELKTSVREKLLKREEDQAKAKRQEQIMQELMKKVTLDLSDNAVEREVTRLVGNLQNQFLSQGLKIETAKLDSPSIRAEYRPQAVSNLTQKLIIEQIARQENIELSEDEIEEIYRHIALYARMDVKRVKEEFADSILMEQSKYGRLQEKVLQIIEDAAVFDTASQTEAQEQEE